MFNITCLDQDGTPIQNFTQWDMGQSILIDGLTLDKPPQVHYWNAQSPQAYVDDKVTLVDGKYKSTVPNALLMSAIAIYVAIYPFNSVTTSGKTIAQVRLSVNPRPEPADYVFENNIDIVYIKDLVKEIDEVKNTVDADLIPKMNAFRAEVSKATTDVKSVSTAEQGKITTKSTEEQNKITTLATTHKQEMQKIKDSIPADYNTLSANMATVLDTFADGIKNSVSGAVVALDDSSAKKCEVEILGKTVQDGEPTPDNPVEIKGVGENGSVGFASKNGNYIVFSESESVTNGITVTRKKDGTIMLNGTATDSISFKISKNDFYIHPNTTYYSKLCDTQTVSGVSYDVWYAGNSSKLDGVKHDYKSNTKKTNMYLIIANGTVLNNVVLKPVFTLDSKYTFCTGRENVFDIPLATPLYGLDKQDRICKKDGVWGVERNCKLANARELKVIYNANSSTDSYYFLEYYLLGAILFNIGGTKTYCSHFLATTNPYLINVTNFCCYQHANSLQYRIKLFKTDIPNYSESDTITTEYLLTKLDELGVKFLVPITPTFEPFSEDIQQKLNALTTYYGTTVMYTADDLQPTINVDYIADTKLYINKQIKNAVADLQTQLASTLSLMPTNVQAEMIENDTNNLLQSI